MKEAFIYGGTRSPFGRYGGVLSGVRADDLMAQVIRGLMAGSQFDPHEIEDVIIGDANQAGEDGRNVARFAALLAGIPLTAGGITINRLCGSGMAAVLEAARAVRCNEGDLFISGGVESMSRAPFAVLKSETAFGRGFKVEDTTLGMRFPNEAFVKEFGNDSLVQTAEHIAKNLGIPRETCDRFAFSSQSKYTGALAAGFYNDEITAVKIFDRKKKSMLAIDKDEHPRPDTTLETLAKLKALSEGGCVTAGNASGVNDGAAALLVGSREAGAKAGMAPRARIIAGAVAGVEPRIMGMGPVPATKKVLSRSGLSIKEMDVIELNEAFAVQVLGCLKEMNIDPEDPRVNVNGGAIAIGHPLGASGARLVLTAMRQLEKCNGRYALATMCIGVGQGIAIILERGMK
jgi:acetyl-CoA C-acetyltransferase